VVDGSGGLPADISVQDELRKLLIADEGYRAMAYDDATGRPPVIKGNLTIGIGHNLTANGLPPFIIDLLYKYDVDKAKAGLMASLPWWQALDPVRQRALISMAFNMGNGTLTTFKVFLNLMAIGQYVEAADDLRNTQYARQLPARVERLAKMIETGVQI
jgi:lysozyme